MEVTYPVLFKKLMVLILITLRKLHRFAFEYPLIVNEISQYQASLWILVAVGALLFAVGFLGCCGSGCENQVFLGLVRYIYYKFLVKVF